MLKVIFSKNWKGGKPLKDDQLLIVLQEDTTFQELSAIFKKVCQRKKIPLVHDWDFFRDIGYRGISQILETKEVEIYSVPGRTLSYHNLPHIHEKDELPLLNTLAIIITDITKGNPLSSKLIKRAKVEGFHFIVSPDGIRQISNEIPQIELAEHLKVLV